MTQPHPAPSLIKRLAAMGYDSLLVFGLLFIATVVFMLIEQQLTSIELQQVETGQTITDFDQVASGWLYTVYLFVITGSFFCYFWQTAGQTLGMQSWRIRIQNSDGSLLSTKQAILRYCSATLSLVCFGLGYLWVFIDKENKTWHDKLSSSETVLLPKTAKK